MIFGIQIKIDDFMVKIRLFLAIAANIPQRLVSHYVTHTYIYITGFQCTDREEELEYDITFT